jgi:hypothetical protein
MKGIPYDFDEERRNRIITQPYQGPSWSERKETLMSDAIETKELLVHIQANGIIRNAATGYLIGRLSDDVQFDSEHLKAEQPSQEQTAKAFAVLKAAMQADSGFAWSWHCNLAMSVYDESRPQCICEILDGKEFSGHRPDCAVVRAHDARHFKEHQLSHEFCNNTAARFMKLCFDVDTSKHPEFTPEEPKSVMPDVPESYGGTDPE